MMALLRKPAINDPDCVDEVLQSVQWMLTSALRRMADNRRADEGYVANAVSRIQRHILEHIDEPDLGPEELAAVLCKSRRSLYLTLGKYGLTPARLISDMRIEICKSALASPRRHRQTITRIALEHGFSDAAQFSRLFKARCGMSPSEWRERALQDPSFAGEAGPMDAGSVDASNQSFQ
jgi:AraC-like DNA-binding protein